MNKKGKTMKQKRISFGQGKGSLTHNNREFMADNVDPLRTPQNITFVRQPIGEAYEQLFAESTERYNARQKRNDRMIHGSYYEHLFGMKPCNTVRKLIAQGKLPYMRAGDGQRGKMLINKADLLAYFNGQGTDR